MAVLWTWSVTILPNFSTRCTNTISIAGTLVFGVATPYLYNPDAGDIGSYSAFLYTFFAGLAVVLTYFFVPEMKGRSAQEIDRMFDLRVPARKFKHWSDDETVALNE